HARESGHPVIAERTGVVGVCYRFNCQTAVKNPVARHRPCSLRRGVRRLALPLPLESEGDGAPTGATFLQVHAPIGGRVAPFGAPSRRSHGGAGSALSALRRVLPSSRSL